MASLFIEKSRQFEKTDGTPAASYYLHFLEVGTLTPKNTYPSEADAIAGTNANSNPIQLNASGRSANAAWITGRYRFIYSDNATPGSGTTIDEALIEDSVPSSDFQDGTPVWAGTAGGTATALTLSFTPELTELADGMAIGWRWASDTTGATTVNPDGLGAKSLVKRDGTAIAAGDGQANDTATARYNSTQNRFELQSPDGMLYRDGNNAPARADVASAATVNLDTSGTNYVRITGTTTITAITLTDGRWRDVVFGGALTLTHNAATLILPGGANITTAAGDTMRVLGESGGAVRVVRYTYASTPALPAMQKIQELAMDGLASVSFDLPAGYVKFIVDLDDFAGSSGTSSLTCDLSTDGGSTFLGSVYDSVSTSSDADSGPAVQRTAANPNGFIHAASVANRSTTATETSSYTVTLFSMGSANRKKVLYSGATFASGADDAGEVHGMINANTTSAINHVRFSITTGTFAGGAARLYGIR